MKKVSLMIAALALVLGLSQCKKDEKPAASGEKQHVVLSASFGDSNSKIAEDGTGGLKWTDENGGTADQIKVYNSSKEIGTLTCKNAANGIFEGEIVTVTGDITFTFGEQKLTEQTGALNDAISLSATAPYDPTGNYNVTMEMPHAVLKLNVSALGTSGALTISDGTSTVASVESVTAPSEVFVAVPADGSQKNYTIGFGGKTATKAWTLAANTFYTKSGSPTGEAIVIEPDAPAAPDGALSGLFTVADPTPEKPNSGDETKVYFSQGNLQCVKKGSTWDNTCTWRFADNQWETEETLNQNVGENYANQDIVSLFGWGTSGNNYEAACYQPWSTNIISANNYGPSSGNLTLEGKSDWGINIGDGKTWRTLTKGEWDYLINTRKVKGETGYGNTCVWATVKDDEDKDVGGLIIFPDGYADDTSDLTSIPDGCVFLPAAGGRYVTSVLSVGSYGNYWSSSCSSSSGYACYLYFLSGYVYPSYNDSRVIGFSVRLVSEK